MAVITSPNPTQLDSTQLNPTGQFSDHSESGAVVNELASWELSWVELSWVRSGDVITAYHYRPIIRHNNVYMLPIFLYSADMERQISVCIVSVPSSSNASATEPTVYSVHNP